MSARLIICCDICEKQIRVVDLRSKEDIYRSAEEIQFGTSLPLSEIFGIVSVGSFGTGVSSKQFITCDPKCHTEALKRGHEAVALTMGSGTHESLTSWTRGQKP